VKVNLIPWSWSIAVQGTGRREHRAVPQDLLKKVCRRLRAIRGVAKCDGGLWAIGVNRGKQ